MKKIHKIFCIIAVIVFITGGLIYYFHSNVYYYSKMSPNGSVITESVLFNDMNYMRMMEGITESDSGGAFWSPDTLLEYGIETNRIIVDKDNTLRYELVSDGLLNANILWGERKPYEVRFAIRLMLYLKSHVLSDQFKKFSAFCGYVETFDIDNFITFSNSKKGIFKMSVDEFNEIYAESNVASLPVERQVDILTQKWIEKTMYFRPYLNGNEYRPLKGLTPKQQLYLICRDQYLNACYDNYDTSKLIVDLFKKENVEQVLTGRDKELFKNIYGSAASSVNGYDYGKASGDKYVYKATYGFKNYTEKELKELFYGKSLTETVKMFR